MHPNKPVVADLMSVTYEMRRNDILTSAMLVKDLLKKYPFLKDKDEVRRDMHFC